MGAPSTREAAAFLKGFLSGYQVARNHALYAVDGRRGHLVYDPAGEPGPAYRIVEGATKDGNRDRAAAVNGEKFVGLRAKADASARSRAAGG